MRNVRQKGSIEWELFVLFGLIALVLLALLSPILLKFVGINAIYSEGERTGVVTKISKKGFIWKTWEGELILGGMDSGGEGALSGQTWKFSIIDDKTADKALLLAKKTRRVTVVYTELWRTAFWQGNTDYIVTELK